MACVSITALTNDDKCCYDPTKYTAWTSKFLKPNSTLITFTSGNVTAMGAESRYNSLNPPIGRVWNMIGATSTMDASPWKTFLVCGAKAHARARLCIQPSKIFPT